MTESLLVLFGLALMGGAVGGGLVYLVSRLSSDKNESTPGPVGSRGTAWKSLSRGAISTASTDSTGSPARTTEAS